jgi:hypothetical protein
MHNYFTVKEGGHYEVDSINIAETLVKSRKGSGFHDKREVSRCSGFVAIFSNILKLLAATIGPQLITHRQSGFFVHMHILYVCTYVHTAAYLLHINLNQRSSTTHLFLTF